MTFQIIKIMKTKILPIILIAFIFTACQSNEKKANKLIKDDLYKSLYDFASYEPVETIIDSAFSSIYRDSTILLYAYQVKAYGDKGHEYLEKMKEAKSTMEIWSDSYSSYGELKFNEAKNEFQENNGNLEKCCKEIEEIYKLIREEANKYPKKFIGWEAKHKFRCKTKGGNPTLANYLYVFDPHFKKIIYSEDTENETLEEVRNIIDEALNEKTDLDLK